MAHNTFFMYSYNDDAVQLSHFWKNDEPISSTCHWLVDLRLIVLVDDDPFIVIVNGVTF